MQWMYIHIYKCMFCTDAPPLSGYVTGYNRLQCVERWSTGCPVMQLAVRWVSGYLVDHPCRTYTCTFLQVQTTLKSSCCTSTHLYLSYSLSRTDCNSHRCLYSSTQILDVPEPLSLVYSYTSLGEQNSCLLSNRIHQNLTRGPYL